ncbi:MAG: hypothetical protein WCW54_01685 [Candidatus Paceibacterota bacterium]
MDNNNPKKSKAFIITFILILILLVAGYYFFKNREQYFGAKGSLSISKVFSPLLGSSKGKDVKVIDTTPTTPVVDTTPAVKKRAGVVITDVNGNKVVRAEAGESLKKGDVLYIAGFNKNDDPIVMKAIANDKNKSLVFGVAGQDMTKGAMLDVIIEGILSGVPTNRKEGTFWIANNPLYLSDKIYGGMTKNAPVSPSFVVPVGSVIKVDAVNGSIRIGDSANNKDMSTLQRNTLNGLNTKLLNLLSTNTNLSNTQKNNIRSLSSSILSAVNGNRSLSNGQMNMINYLNAQILNDIPMDMLDYWGSIFGPINFNVNTPDIGTPGTPGAPAFNPITPPDQTAPANPTTPNTDTGTPPDNNNPAINPITQTVIENKCLAIEKNPLVFTEDEKARLAVLLRKFYLVSSTLRTAEDLTTLNNEIEQNKNFISQIDGLTNQCYDQVTPAMIIANSWKRHGNPWYTKTTGGSFPYTNDNVGYLDYTKLEGGMTPAGFKVISGYYYGKLTKDAVIIRKVNKTVNFLGEIASIATFGFGNETIDKFTGDRITTLGVAGEDCNKFNNFPGYGKIKQINDDPNIYTGHYQGGDGREANGGGFPGDSIISYNYRAFIDQSDKNTTQLDKGMPRKEILEAGCSWKDGVILDNTERILNIW